MPANSGTRRDFLERSGIALGGALVSPYILTGPTARGQEAESRNDRPSIGQIGCGGQGNHITNNARPYADVVALCDVDRQHLDAARANPRQGEADLYADYRHILDRADIDAVIIATPDHWHAKIVIEALQAGKHVYCEKPLTLTIDEGKQICEAAAASDRVVQVGTQQRSDLRYRTAIALARSGQLGRIRRVTCAIGSGPRGGPFPAAAVPTHLDWDRWLGPAPQVEYRSERCHATFRWWYEYSGGKLTDWGAHHVDIAHLVLGAQQTGPVEVFGAAEHSVEMVDGFPVPDDRYNTAHEFAVVARFAGGEEIVITHQTADFENGLLIEGDQGRLFVNREELTGKPVEELDEHPLPEGAVERPTLENNWVNHMWDFMDCIKTGRQPLSDVFSHHRALTTCHLANICIRLGKPLKWDPEAEQIVGDERANSFLSRQPRHGFEIVV